MVRTAAGGAGVAARRSAGGAPPTTSRKVTVSAGPRTRHGHRPITPPGYAPARGWKRRAGELQHRGSRKPAQRAGMWPTRLFLPLLWEKNKTARRFPVAGTCCGVSLTDNRVRGCPAAACKPPARGVRCVWPCMEDDSSPGRVRERGPGRPGGVRCGLGLAAGPDGVGCRGTAFRVSLRHEGPRSSAAGPASQRRPGSARRTPLVAGAGACPGAQHRRGYARRSERQRLTGGRLSQPGLRPGPRGMGTLARHAFPAHPGAESVKS